MALELVRPSLAADFYIKQNDTRPVFAVTAEDEGGAPIAEDITGASVEFHMMTSDGVQLVSGAGLVLDASAKIIGYSWQPGDTATSSFAPDGAGRLVEDYHQAEFQITLAVGGGVMTVPNTRNYTVSVMEEIA
jgi:hypothetical protein